MGTSTNAVLAYGYDLGGEEGFNVRETGEYGELIPGTGGWVPDAESEEGYDLMALMERRLLDASGFTEAYEDGQDDYFGRERAAKEALGVEIETHCSDEYPMYLLIAKKITAHRGTAVDASGFLDAFDDGDLREWDASLASALQALGLTPTQSKPKWLLVSYWG